MKFFPYHTVVFVCGFNVNTALLIAVLVTRLVCAGIGIAYLQYDSSQAAAYAKQKLDGFEYPPGYRVAVRFFSGGGVGGPV